MSARLKRFLWSILALALFVFLLGNASCSHLGVGYRAVLVVRNAGDATSKALAAVAEAKRVGCKKKHKVKTVEYTECVEPVLKALEAWRLYVKPSVNTSLAAAFAVLETAKQRGDKNASWLKAIKPGACALVVSLEQWKPLMPDKVQSVIAMLGSVKGLVCK